MRKAAGSSPGAPRSAAEAFHWASRCGVTVVATVSTILNVRLWQVLERHLEDIIAMAVA